jgi:hypothetical protein
MHEFVLDCIDRETSSSLNKRELASSHARKMEIFAFFWLGMILAERIR